MDSEVVINISTVPVTSYSCFVFIYICICFRTFCTYENALTSLPLVENILLNIMKEESNMITSKTSVVEEETRSPDIVRNEAE